VQGWAIDPDAKTPVNVQVLVDGAVVATAKADGSRPDVAAAYSDYGPAHGFVVDVSASSGNHQVCINAIDLGDSRRVGSLGCRTAMVGGSPIGNFESLRHLPGGARVTGWTIDPDTASPIQVHVYVDSAGTNTGNASTQRSDIGRAFPDYGAAHGFDTVVGAGPGWHNVCAYGINVGGGTNTLLGCRAVLVNPNPFGQLDQVVQVLGGLRVSGWAIDPETAAPIQVHVYVDGGGTNLGYADDSRPDVGSYFGYARYGDLHGFNGVVGAGPGPHWVCA
jgi:hypothetical protein